MDAKHQKFRHELKYVISQGEMMLIENRIKSILALDSHVGESNRYNIRSLYFDDYYNTCYYENENGTDPREKFRIRIYNGSVERITLECKRKERGKTHKTSCPLTIEQAQQLMQGRPLGNIEEQPLLLQKLTYKMLTRNMKPVVIVDYDRIPFVCKNGNVRITLDTNISSSKDIGAFLNPNIIKRPIMPVGHSLLEVKYDEFLPDYIYQALQLQNLRQTAFSKYYLCRKISL